MTLAIVVWTIGDIFGLSLLAVFACVFALGVLFELSKALFRDVSKSIRKRFKK